MDSATESDINDQQLPAPDVRRWLWIRLFRRLVLALLLAALCISYLLWDHIRTLQSLRHVPGTNAYVMDYYVDYNIQQIRSQGMDVNNIEDGLIEVFFPDLLVPIVSRVKERFIEREVAIISSNEHHCSTAVLRTGSGSVFFGRNFDWKHDACLIIKIHDRNSVSSIAVLDLHYLNLDRADLEATNLFERIPLLFAPYYLQDGMNRHGVAVADMSVDDVKPPYDASKPDILHATAMRLILDYAKTADEAIDLLRQYNIHFGETTGHLMIADAAGTSAVVEFIDGQIAVTPTEEHWQVCTNHCVAGKAEEENDEACHRYGLASDQLAVMPSGAGPAEVMRVMASVSQDSTMWTSVYNLSTRELVLAYRRHYDSPWRESLAAAN